MATQARTKWGGLNDGRFSPSGYFRTVQDGAISWLVDPDGGRFLSKGINTVDFEQDRIQNSNEIPYATACTCKYGGREAWRAAIAQRLLRWGFNTLGAWSDEAVANAGPMPLATTPILDLGASYAQQAAADASGGTKQRFPDVFHPTFESHVHDRARHLCAKRSENQSIVGWFIDNELCWGPDWRGPNELLTLFLNMPPQSAGRAAAQSWLRERYTEFDRFKSIWRAPAPSWDAFQRLDKIQVPYCRKPSYERRAADERAADRADPARAIFFDDCERFCGLVAERYFLLTSAAIRIADAHHLLLGCRFAYIPSSAVLHAASQCNEVISFNCYDSDPALVIDRYAATGKACLIGEFSFRAADSGLPNTNGAGRLVATQAARAACFRRYVGTALQRETLVGYHWFEHADQPAAGRFDGENSNFGAVTIDDRVYKELTDTMKLLNAEAECRHAGAARPIA